MTDAGFAESLAASFAAQVRRNPSRAALCADGGNRWSYAELAAQAWGLAHELARRGVRRNARVAIIGGRTSETVVAILAVLSAGGAYSILDPASPPMRRRRVLDDLEPAVIIATDAQNDIPADISCPFLRLFEQTWSSQAGPVDTADASTLAYVLFTSGSTGRPKGVMVEHGSVLNMLRSYERLAPAHDGFTGAIVSPVAFDVSVWEIFSVLAYGGTLHVPSERRLTSGGDLWDHLCDTAIQSAYVPPGLLPSLVEAAKRQRGSLHRLLVGVEPIPQGLIQRFRNACPELRIVNGYGPTETTITATLHLVADATDPDRRVPIGRPVDGSRIEIVHGDLSPVDPGDVGEIVVFGACLARGYVDKTDGGFIEIAGDRAYRTGDYGRLLAGGAIEFVGRTDGQIKINGFRVEIGEVEAALSAMPQIGRSVVIPAGDSNAQRLIAAVEAPAQILATDVRQHLLERLPTYAVPSRIVVLRTLPQTANGKVDVPALLAIDRNRHVDARPYVAPESSWHQLLAEAWSLVLGIADVGLDDDFCQSGGSSLDAVRIAAYVSERGHSIQAGSILAARTIRALEESDVAPRMTKAIVAGVAPATRAQEGLWAWRELHPESAATTVVHTIALYGAIDRVRLQRAFRGVVDRHEALRTTFQVQSDRELLQHVAAPSHWELPIVEIDSPADVDREIRRCLEHRFHRDSLPWTARLLIGTQFGAIVFAADHLVFDGESAAILQRDIARSYDEDRPGRTVPGPASLGPAASPPPHRVPELRRWWDRALEGYCETAILPEPFTHGTSPDTRVRLEAVIDNEVWERIVTLAWAARTTPFVVVLAALKSFLRERGGSADNMVSIAFSRRHVLGCPSAIGNFVNLIPIRDMLERSQTVSMTFSDYLPRMSEGVRAAIARSDLPFEDMIAHVARPADARVTALARVVLAQQVPTPAIVSRSGLRFAAWPYRPSNAIHDLAVFFSEARDDAPAQLEWVWAPDTTLEQTIEWMATAFAVFLRAAVEAPTTPLSVLPVLAPPEVALIADTARPHGPAAGIQRETLVSLFEAQERRRPNAIAVQESGTLVTYAELARRARDIATRLELAGTRHPVVIVLDKSVDQLAAMLAVLKAGAPYLPLAPDHARTRLPDLARRSGALVCIATSNYADTIELPDSCRIVLVDTPLPAGDEPAAPAAASGPVLPDDLAYIMPTSGSTGAPKLVGIPHRAVVRLVYRNDHLPLDATDRTMLIANSSFDAATLEVWGALANGGRVIVPTREQLHEPSELAAAIERHGVTTAFFTTTFFERMLDYIGRLRAMRHVIVGGEAVPPLLFAVAAEVIPRTALVNGYGPTENTTFSCCFRLDREPRALRSLPIGRPISGSGAVVVDETLRPVPPGMVGEILVTGDGLAIGYVDDPDLTRQRFVAIPSLHGARAYRTGDLGRLLPEGVLEYLGRADRQLKIRGFRIEPGEVETILSAHPAVRRGVVYADSLGGIRALMAAVEGVGVNEADLRKWLADRVPDYLVPSRFYVVDRLPMTSNGKLDHAALRDGYVPRRHPRYEPRRTDLERIVVDIAAQLIDVASLGVDDNLFDFGMNSMAVLALAARLSRCLGRPIPSHLIYSAPTVRALAARIDTNASADGEAVTRLRHRASRIRKSPLG
ncbi:MAG TPA: amino acid adenylation domain-containing protein [Thermoanaerobaculia bacterium]|nr:amino acid adenylation domain-containing protein [Thermoanaerobaculia bacterium]